MIVLTILCLWLCSYRTKKQAHFRKCSHAFFMELVSTLCFGGQEAPESELIKMLINTVFTEKPQAPETKVDTRELSYAEREGDEVPVIRSFLLQLLLEHR